MPATSGRFRRDRRAHGPGRGVHDGAAALAGQGRHPDQPRALDDLLIRTGPAGDLFGLRRNGLVVEEAAARRHPHGVALPSDLPVRKLEDCLRHADQKIHLGDAERYRRDSTGSTRADRGPVDFPLRLIGLREVRSHNSWMHNSPKLSRTADASGCDAPVGRRGAGVAEGGDAGSPRVGGGSITVPVTHHRGDAPRHRRHPARLGPRRRLAAGQRGRRCDVNFLASSRPEDVEALAGILGAQRDPRPHRGVLAVRDQPPEDQQVGAAPVSCDASTSADSWLMVRSSGWMADPRAATSPSNPPLNASIPALMPGLAQASGAMTSRS